MIKGLRLSDENLSNQEINQIKLSYEEGFENNNNVIISSNEIEAIFEKFFYVYKKEEIEQPTFENFLNVHEKKEIEGITIQVIKNWIKKKLREQEVVESDRKDLYRPGEVYVDWSAIDVLEDKNWKMEFGENFLQDIKKMDMKIKARIFQAITELTQSPLENKGNTKKPLTSDLTGQWRYRIGDYRLIYYPNNPTPPKIIKLISFSARSGAYN